MHWIRDRPNPMPYKKLNMEIHGWFYCMDTAMESESRLV